MPSINTQLALTIDDKAAAHVRERGGVLTIRTRPQHGCCGGRVDRATVSTEPPEDVDAYAQIKKEGLRMYVHRGLANPFAVAVMDEVGIDISEHTSDLIDAYDDTPLDIVVTVCDDAAENCPYLPARKHNLHRGFEDPSVVKGAEEEKRAAFRRIRDELADWIDETFPTDR